MDYKKDNEFTEPEFTEYHLGAGNWCRNSLEHILLLSKKWIKAWLQRQRLQATRRYPWPL